MKKEGTNNFTAEFFLTILELCELLNF